MTESAFDKTLDEAVFESSNKNPKFWLLSTVIPALKVLIVRFCSAPLCSLEYAAASIEHVSDEALEKRQFG